MTRSWFNAKTSDLEDVEAARLFATFLAAESDSLHQLEALTGVASDSPLMTIDSQVSEAARRWDEDDPDITLPIWYGNVEIQMGLGSVGSSIYDGLIYRVGKELTNALGGEWILYKDPRPKAAWHNQPALSVPTAPRPWSVVRKAVVGVRAGNQPDSWLREKLESVIAEGQSDQPTPGEASLTKGELRVFVEDHNDASWTHRGSLPEETEHIIGTRGVEQLWTKMNVVTGVRAMHMEDFPDSFYISAPGIEAAHLGTMFQQLFDEADPGQIST